MSDAPKVVVFGCTRSAGASLEELEALGKRLPDCVEWASVPCGATVDDLLILRAFEAGADRVMVLVCNDSACRSMDGSHWAEKRTAAARALLGEIGLGEWRLAFQHIGPNMPLDLLAWVEEFCQADGEQAVDAGIAGSPQPEGSQP